MVVQRRKGCTDKALRHTGKRRLSNVCTTGAGSLSMGLMNVRFAAFLFWVACAMPLGAAECSIEDCLDIESHLQRLECYDVAARQIRRQQPVAEQPVPEERSPVESDRPAGTSETSAPRPPSQPDEVVMEEKVVRQESPVAKENTVAEKTVRKEKKNRFSWIPFVGKKTQDKKEKQRLQIESKIVAVRKSPGGQHIMTLANGQVWAENEAGAADIEANQSVTIVQQRFNFVMHLTSGRFVVVHEVD